MKFQNAQNFSEIDQLLTVQLESFDRSATRRSQPDHQSSIIIPAEMIRPSLAARVEQSNSATCQRINAIHLVVLAIIASCASPGQIFDFGFAAARNGNDVLDIERLRDKTPDAVAVLTEAICSGFYGATLRCRWPLAATGAPSFA
jgi:hypothetical protein